MKCPARSIAFYLDGPHGQNAANPVGWVCLKNVLDLWHWGLRVWSLPFCDTFWLLAVFTKGMQTRSRSIVIPSQDGGRQCAQPLVQQRPCRYIECFKWLLSDWGNCHMQVRNKIPLQESYRSMRKGDYCHVGNYSCRGHEDLMHALFPASTHHMIKLSTDGFCTGGNLRKTFAHQKP